MLWFGYVHEPNCTKLPIFSSVFELLNKLELCPALNFRSRSLIIWPRTAWILSSTTEGLFRINVGILGNIAKINFTQSHADILIPALSGRFSWSTLNKGFPINDVRLELKCDKYNNIVPANRSGTQTSQAKRWAKVSARIFVFLKGSPKASDNNTMARLGDPPVGAGAKYEPSLFSWPVGSPGSMPPFVQSGQDMWNWSKFTKVQSSDFDMREFTRMTFAMEMCG